MRQANKRILRNATVHQTVACPISAQKMKTHTQKLTGHLALGVALFLTVSSGEASAVVQDELAALPPKAVQLEGYFQGHIQNSIDHWNKGVVPYSALVQMFAEESDRNGP